MQVFPAPVPMKKERTDGFQVVLNKTVTAPLPIKTPVRAPAPEQVASTLTAPRTASTVKPARSSATVQVPTPHPTPASAVTSTTPPLPTTAPAPSNVDYNSDSNSDSGPDIIYGKRYIDTGTEAALESIEAEDPELLEIMALQTLEDLCDQCAKRPSRKCKTCGCSICGSKNEEDKQLMCDQCDMYYHMYCLNPPLQQPPEGEWFCSECKGDDDDDVHIVETGQSPDHLETKSKEASEIGGKHDDSHIVGTQRNLDLSKDKSNDASETKRVGVQQASLRKIKTCTIAGPHHFGPIPGIEVGQTWKFRNGVSESGVHRPNIAGISGNAKVGSQSIVFSGGYPGDIDNGDTFLYSGCGGTLGNKSTSTISCDQTLTSFNLALAVSCDAQVDDKAEVRANNWRNSKPVRVVRTDKLRKRSKYAPEVGARYDGIYKLVRYWPEKNAQGFTVIRYEFRRDDPAPAPWTAEGKKRMEELGLEMIYPKNYDFEAAATKAKDRKKRKKRDLVEVSADMEATIKKKSRTDSRASNGRKKLINTGLGE